MNKAKLSWGKTSLVTALSLGFMTLGIGCILWVMFSMWAQAKSDYYDNATRSNYSMSDNFTSEQNTLTEDGTDSVKLSDSPTNLNTDKTIYSVYPSEGDNIGSLTIPALKRKLPIIQGTSAKELDKGVGHFTQSVLPGEKDNCVFSGHRDTVFRQLGKLKIGDQLIVKTSAGTFTYKVSGTRIVHADDRTVIVPTDHAVLTMTTCYPFYFVGYAPDRYIVSAALVKSK